MKLCVLCAHLLLMGCHRSCRRVTQSRSRSAMARAATEALQCSLRWSCITLPHDALSKWECEGPYWDCMLKYCKSFVTASQ